MFKNSVFNVSVDTQKWFKAMLIRAIKTFAQTMLSMITVGAAISEVDWTYIISCSMVALVASFLTSVAGLPEVEAVEEEKE